jgi:hypothetical protein
MTPNILVRKRPRKPYYVGKSKSFFYSTQYFKLQAKRKEAHDRAEARAQAASQEVSFSDIMVGMLLQAPPHPNHNLAAESWYSEHMIVTDIIPHEHKVVTCEIYWDQPDRDAPHAPLISRKAAARFENDTAFKPVIIEDDLYGYPRDACINMWDQITYTPDKQCRIRGRVEWDSFESFLMEISLRKKDRAVPTYRI